MGWYFSCALKPLRLDPLIAVKPLRAFATVITACIRIHSVLCAMCFNIVHRTQWGTVLQALFWSQGTWLGEVDLYHVFILYVLLLLLLSPVLCHATVVDEWPCTALSILLLMSPSWLCWLAAEQHFEMHLFSLLLSPAGKIYSSPSIHESRGKSPRAHHILKEIVRLEVVHV